MIYMYTYIYIYTNWRAHVPLISFAEADELSWDQGSTPGADYNETADANLGAESGIGNKQQMRTYTKSK